MPGTTSYYHCDASGNVRALTDSNQTVTDRYTYDAFGNTVAQSGTTENNFRFGGQVGYHLNPDSGSYYVRQREYQPVVIRWLSVDPIGFRGDGYNLYRYALNSPVSMIDPSGLKEEPPSCNCEDVLKEFLSDWKKSPIGDIPTIPLIPQIVQKAMKCNPHIYCDSDCGGLDGQTFLDNGYINVCLPSKAKSAQILYGLLLHELTHVVQYVDRGFKCDNNRKPNRTPKLDPPECKTCAAFEQKAYEHQAQLLYREVSNQRKFIAWGVCTSCKHCEIYKEVDCDSLGPKIGPTRPFPSKSE